MKSAGIHLGIILGLSLVALPALTFAAEPATAPTGAVSQPDQSARVDALVAAIQHASEPAAAIQAYADAQAVASGNLAVEQAYVQRMVDLGLPEMADTQAQDLLRRDPESGLGWGVSAYISAKREQTTAAMFEISNAVKFAPKDPFVLRTAGQLIARYDAHEDHGQAPDNLNETVERLRAQLAGSVIYADAYADAAQTYKQQAETPASQPTSAAASTSSPTPATVYGQTYENPYYVTSPIYSYWWPHSYWGWNWWWPTCSTGVIVDHHFFHDHQHFFHQPFVRGLNDGRFGHGHDGNLHFGGAGGVIRNGRPFAMPLMLSDSGQTSATVTGHFTAAGGNFAAGAPRQTVTGVRNPSAASPRSQPSAGSGGMRRADAPPSQTRSGSGTSSPRPSGGAVSGGSVRAR
jgi:hypothetical protein